jgi:hypothetical protein
MLDAVARAIELDRRRREEDKVIAQVRSNYESRRGLSRLSSEWPKRLSGTTQ